MNFWRGFMFSCPDEPLCNIVKICCQKEMFFAATLHFFVLFMGKHLPLQYKIEIKYNQ